MRQVYELERNQIEGNMSGVAEMLVIVYYSCHYTLLDRDWCWQELRLLTQGLVLRTLHINTSKKHVELLTRWKFLHGGVLIKHFWKGVSSCSSKAFQIPERRMQHCAVSHLCFSKEENKEIRWENGTDAGMEVITGPNVSLCTIKCNYKWIENKFLKRQIRGIKHLR